MIPKGARVCWKKFIILSGIVALAAPQTGLGGRIPLGSTQVLQHRIIQYLRDRFQVPENVTVSAEPLRGSAFNGFYEMIVNTDDGKQKKSTKVYATVDGMYLVIGEVFTFGSNFEDEFAQHARAEAKLPTTTAVNLSAFGGSAFPEFLKATLTVIDGKKQQSADAYMTKDGRTGILGNVFPIGLDVVHTIGTKNQPHMGSMGAPVTIVEYADLQCPMCARFHEYLTKEFLPKYRDNVCIFFKEFPLSMHDWATTAAVANECLYQISPSLFLPYRSMIFANQATLNTTNVRDQMLNFAEQVGSNRVKVAACLDAKGTLAGVEGSRREGEKLGVTMTPTSFVNGRIVVGIPPGSGFEKIVNDALANVRTTTKTRANK